MAARKTAPIPQSEGYRWGMTAGLAESLADELVSVAKRLRSKDEPAETKERLAGWVHRASRAVRGVREDKAVKISLVVAIEQAIDYVRRVRTTRAAALARLQAHPADELAIAQVQLTRWLDDETEEREAHARFSIEWPEHARKMRLKDWRMASAAVRGKTKNKWGTLAGLIEDRLAITCAPSSLQSYLKRHRQGP